MGGGGELGHCVTTMFPLGEATRQQSKICGVLQPPSPAPLGQKDKHCLVTTLSIAQRNTFTRQKVLVVHRKFLKPHPGHYEDIRRTLHYEDIKRHLVIWGYSK